MAAVLVLVAASPQVQTPPVCIERWSFDPAQARSYYVSLQPSQTPVSLVSPVPGANGFMITDLILHPVGEPSTAHVELLEDTTVKTVAVAGSSFIERRDSQGTIKAFGYTSVGSSNTHLHIGIPIRAGRNLQLRASGSPVDVTLCGYLW
ncbi:MAG: hypothetical protein K8H99_07245 [Nitrospirae bacterium]|nr:hypothetical protein [Fimbriimonadaceae bacterium]